MNVQPNDQKRRTGDPEESPFTISTANLVTMGKPIGTFAGSEDFIMRIRNGKLVTAVRVTKGEVKIRKIKLINFSVGAEVVQEGRRGEYRLTTRLLSAQHSPLERAEGSPSTALPLPASRFRGED